MPPKNPGTKVEGGNSSSSYSLSTDSFSSKRFDIFRWGSMQFSKLRSYSAFRNDDALNVIKLSWVVVAIFLILLIQLAIRGFDNYRQHEGLIKSLSVIRRLRNLDEFGDTIRLEFRFVAAQAVANVSKEELANIRKRWLYFHNNTIKMSISKFSRSWPFIGSWQAPPFAVSSKQWLRELELHSQSQDSLLRLDQFNYFMNLFSLLSLPMKHAIHDSQILRLWPQFTTYCLLLRTNYLVQHEYIVATLADGEQDPSLTEEKMQDFKVAQKLLRFVQMVAKDRGGEMGSSLEGALTDYLTAVRHPTKDMAEIEGAYRAWDSAFSQAAGKASNDLIKKLRSEITILANDGLWNFDIFITTIGILLCLLASLAMWKLLVFFTTLEAHCYTFQKRSDQCSILLRKYCDPSGRSTAAKNMTIIPKVYDDVGVLAVRVKKFDKFAQHSMPGYVVDLLNTLHCALEKATAMYNCLKVDSREDCFLVLNLSQSEDNVLGLALIAVHAFDSMSRTLSENELYLQAAIQCGQCFASHIGGVKMHYECFGEAVASALDLVSYSGGRYTKKSTILVARMAKERLDKIQDFRFAFESYDMGDDRLGDLNIMVDATRTATPCSDVQSSSTGIVFNV